MITISVGACSKIKDMNEVSDKPSPMPSITPTILPTDKLPETLNDHEESTDELITSSPNKSFNDDLNEYLCSENEVTLFSFQIDNSDKRLSICTSKNQPSYIVYRFGTKGQIELEYPKKKDSSSWNAFIYSYYVRGGGAGNEGLDINYLSFQNGGYEYKIFEEYYAVDNIYKVGVTVTNLETGEETCITGDSDSIQGSLISLRDTSIQTEED